MIQSSRARSERAAQRPSGTTTDERRDRSTDHTPIAISPAAPTPAGRVLKSLSSRVGAAEVERYFPGQAVLYIGSGRLEVRARTGFMAQQIKAKLLKPLTDAAREEIDPAIRVDFTADAGAFASGHQASVVAPIAASSPVPIVAAHRQRPQASPAEKRYRLEDFVVGECNKLAFTAAERLADTECPRGFSPLFIHGACGVGKTHILQGVAARFKEKHPGAVVRCISGENFTNEFITALRGGKIENFRKAYRGVDLLCIDDVHFLESKTATQEELLHTFNAIDISGARVVLASDEHPRHVGKLSEALISRFLSGMVVKIGLPESALRERLTRIFAERRGLRLEPAAVQVVAARCGGPGSIGGSVRDIEGALTRVDAIRSMLPDLSTGPEIGLAVVRKALNLTPEQSCIARVRRPIRMDSITQTVCRTLGVQIEEILGRSKHQRVVLARTLCSYLARQLTTMSFPEIARALGRNNHSTVVTAAKRFERQLTETKDLTLADHGPDLSHMTLRDLFERLREDIQRTAAAA